MADGELVFGPSLGGRQVRNECSFYTVRMDGVRYKMRCLVMRTWKHFRR